MDMEFRLFLPQMRLSINDLVHRARVAEQVGFGGIALMDHLAPPMAEDQPMYDAIVASSWLAASTSTLGIGHLVLCDAMRHPAVLAKEAVTLDHASVGRFELGIGWGSVPSELDRFGVGTTDAATRVRRLTETLDVLKALWSGEKVDYEGEFHHLRGVQQLPAPLAPIPLVIGGAGPKTLALVARHATWWNLPLGQIDRLDQLREQTGSARVSIQMMVALVPDEAQRDEVTQVANRRFGVYGDGLVIASAAELVERFGDLAQRGVERTYVWFADFARDATLERFGSDVIGHIASALQPPTAN